MTGVFRFRLLALGAALVVFGGVACSAAPNLAELGSKVGASPASSPPQTESLARAARGGAAAPAPVTAGDQAHAVAPAAPGAASASTPAAQTNSSLQSQSFDRMVIRTAQLTLEVEDMESSLAQVRAIAQQAGGFVSASNTRIERVNDQERTVADLTIQVRSDGADGALSALRALGKVSGETSGSQDVTEEYVDLDSNLRNLQASEAAILKLMDKATRIEDVLALQRELSNVRGQIERVQGRKRYLERRTDMATISVSLRLPPVEGARPAAGAWNPATFAQRGWQASLSVLRGVAEIVIMILAFSWWLLPLGLVAFYIWQRRRTRTTPAAPTGVQV